MGQEIAQGTVTTLDISSRIGLKTREVSGALEAPGGAARRATADPEASVVLDCVVT